MLTENEIRDMVHERGLGCVVYDNDYSESDIEDKELAELWRLAIEALEMVDCYLFPIHGYTE